MPPTMALRWEVFVRLVHHFEYERHGQSFIPPMKVVAAAALYELLENRHSMRWICQRSPYGIIRDGGSCQRATRIACILRSEVRLHPWVHLPPLCNGVDPLEQLPSSLRRVVEGTASRLVLATLHDATSIPSPPPPPQDEAADGAAGTDSQASVNIEASVKIEASVTIEAIDGDIVELDAQEVVVMQRELAAERVQLEQGHAEAVAVQQEHEQERRRSKRLRVYDKRESQRKCAEYRDLFMCSTCYFPSYYPRGIRACNKLTCGNPTCGINFCIICGKPASASCRCISAAWAR